MIRVFHLGGGCRAVQARERLHLQPLALNGKVAGFPLSVGSVSFAGGKVRFGLISGHPAAGGGIHAHASVRRICRCRYDDG
jgi:hypothetical protein